jgi:type IV secretion system protein TrbI
MNPSDEPPAAPPHQPKADPESLVLRGRPRPVVRFRRGVIVGGVAAVSAGLIGLTWMALEPVTFRSVAGDSSGRPYERATPEPLARAPRDYRDVPVLGPPLPGDLGRPILEQQRRLDAGPPEPTAAAVPDASVQRAETEGQQRVAAEEAARNSSVVVQLTDQRPLSSTEDARREAMTAASPARSDKVQLGDWGRSDQNPHLLAPAVSQWTIAAGSVIPASLLTGLNSDLPGMVLAQVTENVRDSRSGTEILVPQGSRLVGKYDSGVAYGQRRAFVIWQRILFPDGSSLRLDDMPASDSAGDAGLAERVDGHGWQLIKGVVLSSLLGAGSQLSLGGDHGLVRALRESIQQSGSQAGQQVVSKGLDVQPTIRVRPGWPVRVLVSEDLVLRPWKG